MPVLGGCLWGTARIRQPFRLERWRLSIITFPSGSTISELPKHVSFPFRPTMSARTTQILFWVANATSVLLAAAFNSTEARPFGKLLLVGMKRTAAFWTAMHRVNSG